MQDILTAAAKGSSVTSGGENKEGESDVLSNEGWVDNIGQGRKDEDNLSLYVRFSEGDEKNEGGGANGWRIDGFKDITTNGNKMEILNEAIFTTEPTTSNVDVGEPGKVRPLYDLVFRRDVMENEQAGMLVTIPRGSSLDVGMFHTSDHDSRQRATLEFWFYLPKLGSSEIVLARRSIVQQGDDMKNLSTSTESSTTMVWELVALPSGRLEFRTNGGSIINSSSVTPDNNEFRVDSDDEDKDAGMVSLPRDDGYGGWNHVSLFFSCRKLDLAKCNVSMTMKGAFIASSEVSFQLDGVKNNGTLDEEQINQSLETTALLFGLGGIEGLRFTEIRAWSCARSFEDVKMMMYEYLDIAKMKKKLKIQIRNKKDAKGSKSILIPPRSTERKVVLDRPRTSAPVRRSQLDSESVQEENSSGVISFANFDDTDGDTGVGSIEENSLPMSSESKIGSDETDMREEAMSLERNATEINYPYPYPNQPRSDDIPPSGGSDVGSKIDERSSPSISIHESPLISDEIRKSAAAALIRGPPATRHFGGNRGGLLSNQATR